ncbi:MAG: asparagine synthase (glutamine-hydrolyzing) [Kiritimatiellia bacterium]
MCGIAGFVGVAREEVQHAIEAMNRALAHRGPDDEGANYFALPDNRWLGLGHRRLSIIDLSPAGHQPMLDPATGNALVFNGEIYNFQALRAMLQQKGHTFVSQTDTEVLLKGYAEWGVEVFRRLEGMYAVAIYDAASRKLCLARDPLGIKPLYVFQCRDQILFASEVRALAKSGCFECRVDRRGLAGFLAYGAIQEPLTLYEGVRMLPPGTMLQFDLANPAAQPAKTQFWTFPVSDTRPPCTRPEAVEHIRELLERSVERHLVSDVPVGVFLSGGLDSAVVAAFATRKHVGAIHTYTVALAKHVLLDESAMAEETARAINSTHISIHLSDDDVTRYARNWFSAVDQPSIDGLNTFIVAGAARECGIKVALSGLGGDELFGGYGQFSTLPRQQRLLKLLAVVPSAWRVRLVRLAQARQPEYIRRKVEDMVLANPASILALTLARRRLFSNRSLQEFGFDARELGLDDVWIDAQNPARGQLPPFAKRDVLSAVSTIESLFYMRNTLLRDTDVMGMAHGMELRVPLLDQQLVDFVGKLPGAWRVHDRGVSKPLLAEAVAPVLNKPGIARRVKQGFSLPHAAWMRTTLRAEFENKLENLKSSGWMAPEKVDRVWLDFLESSSDTRWSRVWSLGILGHCVGTV